MPVYFRQMVLLAKIEAAYATDPTLTGASNSILAKNVTLRPMEGQDVSRDLISAYLGGQATIPAGLNVVIEFATELAGSGEAGTAPAWGVLLRAGGAAEVVDADTSVTYSPISDAMESVYMKFWLGGTLHALKGARGTGVINLDAQAVPQIQWTFTGLWVPPADVARATPDFSAYVDPLIVCKANTPQFKINNVSLVLRNYSLDLGNQVEGRFLANDEKVLITDHVEQLTATVEVTPLATFDPFTLANAQTQVPVLIQHGTAAGNIVTITAPTCQIKRPPAATNNQGIAERQYTLSPLPTDAGNDQWSMVLT